MPAQVIYFDDPTDRELLLRIRDGDRQAFDVFYLRHWKDLFNAAHKRLQDLHASEEVVQDLFVHFYQICKDLDITISVSGYLHTALRNRILNHLRNSQKRVRHSLLATMDAAKGDYGTSNTIARRSLEEAIEQCLVKMPSKYSNVFRLNRQHHLTVREAAVRLGISENQAEKYLHKALVILRKELAGFFIAAGVILSSL